MIADPRHRSAPRQPLASIGAVLMLGIVLGLPAGAALAANPRATLVQPASTGNAKAARQRLLKERTTVVGLHQRHPGKTVGGSSTPLPKTVVTKRFLPK
jgi:hypothetical protein